jgi:hypothetical protein
MFSRKKNKYDLSGDYGICTIDSGEKFIFDLEDYDKISKFCWCIGSKGYFLTHDYNNNYKTLRLHRLIMNVSDVKLQVDHINHDISDNRKIDLRIVSNGQNSQNRGLRKCNTSGVTGVYFYKPNKKWSARINISSYQEKNLGYFDTFEDAVKARKEAEDKYYGEYAYKE